MFLQLKSQRLDLRHVAVMGIVNVTPDSFSDGGLCLDPGEAVHHGLGLAEEGAALLDVGGESTRPGAEPVPVPEELARVLPVIRALSEQSGLPVSVDTSKPEVMVAAAEAGAEMINDVNGLRSPGALEAAAATGCGICLMHMRGEPRTMQKDPVYGDVVEDVYAFLAQRMDAAVGAGVVEDRICVDPGFWFGKTLAHNLSLMKSLDRFLSLGRPVLVGVSRKSMLGAVTGRPVGDRRAAGVAAAVMAAERGARLVRTHDVAPTVDGLKMVEAVLGAS
ncbi:MAG: dihydropteroate synthase [Gammaproteobacteria bacterium]